MYINTANCGVLPRLWAARLLAHISKMVTGLEDSWLENCPALELLPGVAERAEEIGPARALRKTLRELERANEEIRPRSMLEKQVGRLAREIGLKSGEAEILVFCRVFASVEEFSSTVVLAWQNYLDPSLVEGILSIMLQLKPSRIRKALAPDKTLRRSGLLAPDENACRANDFPAQFAVLELGPAFAEIFDHDFARRASVSEPLMLLQCEAQGSSDQFCEMGSDLELIKNHLDSWTGDNASQVLLWGSESRVLQEFAALVAETCGRASFMANPKAGEKKGARDGEQALVAVRYCEAFANKQNKPGVLISGFSSSYSFEGDALLLAEARSRASVPTFWLLESVGGLSLEMIACFDLAVQVELDSDKQAERDVESLPGATAKLGDAGLEPNHRRRVVQAVAQYKATDPCGDFSVQRFADRAIVNAAELQEACMGSFSRSSEQKQKARPRPQSQYDPNLINADVDLSQILASAKRQEDLRILLYGPPGTGKTEFAKQLSLRSGRELVVERASDLLGCYVGESEKNIARAFENAQEKVLLIDEVDGLLFSRDNARRNHERSQVGEMLTSMEDFRGILVATTNDRGCLDPASERRFDVKATLNYLTLAQKLNRAMTVLPECAPREQESLQQQLAATLDSLPLTPDDFERVRRNASVLGVDTITPAFLINFLKTEASGRIAESKSRGMGFTAHI